MFLSQGGILKSVCKDVYFVRKPVPEGTQAAIRVWMHTKKRRGYLSTVFFGYGCDKLCRSRAGARDLRNLSLELYLYRDHWYMFMVTVISRIPCWIVGQFSPTRRSRNSREIPSFRQWPRTANPVKCMSRESTRKQQENGSVLVALLLCMYLCSAYERVPGAEMNV